LGFGLLRGQVVAESIRTQAKAVLLQQHAAFSHQVGIHAPAQTVGLDADRAGCCLLGRRCGGMEPSKPEKGA
jgi:hypothetical protein